ncbi:MAG: M23 family metallopeptidase [Erythrobacter sp.]|jgi:murein DD-endopeptidase MepM/ murein hydrolase activator NlpD
MRTIRRTFLLGTIATAWTMASVHASAQDAPRPALAVGAATGFGTDFGTDFDTEFDTESDGAAMEGYDRPVIRFGRAVDLAGADILPPVAGAAQLTGGRPAGWPLACARVTSGYGMRYHPILGETRFHAGVDLAAPAGTPVVATSGGRVALAGWSGNYGILVALNHAGSLETRYAHLSAVAVRPGQAVQAGQVIGYVGTTGRSTGPHLHYETRVAGHPTNPGG